MFQSFFLFYLKWYNNDMELYRNNIDIYNPKKEASSEKEDVLDVRQKIESEMQSVQILKNEDDKLITLDGLESEYQDEQTYKYINTPTFKSWYHGQLTERNEPISLYHATGDYFDKFDPEKMYSGRGFLNIGAGFYIGYNRNLDLYIKIAKGKMPKDEIRQKKILDIDDEITHLRSELNILREKHEAISLPILSEWEILETNKSKLEDQMNSFSDKLDHDYIELIRFEGKELSFVDKVKLYFDENKKEFHNIFLEFKKLELLSEKNRKFFKKNHDNYLFEVNKIRETIEEKQKEIKGLMPKGVMLEVFANVSNILDFNDPINEAKLVEVKKVLKNSSYDESLLDKYLTEEGVYNGESLYKALTRIITGQELKHHLDLKENEKQVDTRPVSDFLSKNKIYDASRYTVLEHTYTAPFGQKTLIVYDTNDLLILPETKE